MAERIIQERIYPIGIQSFPEIIEGGHTYVDRIFFEKISIPMPKHTYLLLSILAVLVSSCGHSDSWHKSQGMIWNTVWHATYRGPEEAISAAIDSLKGVEASVSAFDDNSLVSRINRCDSGPADRHLTAVYETSRRINRISGGLFDPTISPLIKAWGFGKGHTPTADTARIEAILPYVGIGKTRIENGVIYKNSPGISFNFSAIAKGYGVDVAARTLLEHGCADLMMEIGGEVVCRGHNPEGGKWRILIETPDEEYLKEAFGNCNAPACSGPLIVELTDEALATSGNYRNYHSEAGNVFGHTISPLTGRPVTTDILSASVIAPTCMEADALATACMAMGSAGAMEMLDSAGYAGAFILRSGEVRLNSGMMSHLAR